MENKNHPHYVPWSKYDLDLHRQEAIRRGQFTETPRLRMTGVVRVHVFYALFADFVSRWFNYFRITWFTVFIVAGVLSLLGHVPSARHHGILDIVAVAVLARKTWSLIRIEFLP